MNQEFFHFRRGNQWIWIAFLLFFMLISLTFMYGISMYVNPDDPRGMIISYLKNFSYPVFSNMMEEIFITPVFLLGVFAILILEKLFPAKPSQKFFSVSFAQDLVWAVLFPISTAIFTVGYVHMLESIYHRHFNFLTIEAMRQFPDWVRFMWGVVLLDFLRWLQHIAQHKVPWFWLFHCVHHSQRNLNMFTDFRYHVFEYLVRHSVYVFPLLLLSVGTPEITYFTLFLVWHARFYHSNIKMNLGPLRYVIVTPQSHRIHHSIETKHYHKNFGAWLSIWDYLFKTQYKGHDEYPNTGIKDEIFPHEFTAQGLHLLLTPLAQMMYPFWQIGQSLKRTAATAFKLKNEFT